MSKETFACVALILVGCGGSSLTIDEFDDDVQTQQCQFDVRCCQNETNAAVYTTVTDCQSASAPGVASDLASVKAAIVAGLVRFDASAAAACLSALKAAEATCTTNLDSFLSSTVCGGALTGAVKTGGACPGDDNYALALNATSACENGLYCDENSTCQPDLALGASCDDSNTCVDGSYCAGTCSPTMANGATCTYSDECTSHNCGDNGCAPLDSSTSIDLCTAQS